MRRYSIRTGESRVSCIERLSLFYGNRHPLEMGEDEIAEFLWSTHSPRPHGRAVAGWLPAAPAQDGNAVGEGGPRSWKRRWAERTRFSSQPRSNTR